MDLIKVLCAIGIVAMLAILASQLDRLINEMIRHANCIDSAIEECNHASVRHANSVDRAIVNLNTRVYECNRALIQEIRDYRNIEDYIKERDRYRDALWQIAHRDKPPTEYAAKALEEQE